MLIIKKISDNSNDVFKILLNDKILRLVETNNELNLDLLDIVEFVFYLNETVNKKIKSFHLNKFNFSRTSSNHIKISAPGLKMINLNYVRTYTFSIKEILYIISIMKNTFNIP